jgi:predicted transglutaminase-like cysteine proteinase
MSQIAALAFSMMVLGSPMSTPNGYAGLCARQHETCDRFPARHVATKAGRIVVSQQAIDQIAAINNAVNREIEPTFDPTDWTLDRWKGDCKQYSLNKRQALLRAGFPTSAVVLATAWVAAEYPRVAMHMVVIVRTTGGDFVLDNLRDQIVPWHQTHYWWLEAQSPENPKEWRSIR